MAKAFDDETNETLRGLARKLMAERADGKGVRLAELLDVSPAFISEFLSGKRGAGLETLSGLGRFAPLELLRILGIEPAVIVTLLEGQSEELEVGLANLPEVVRRAARAAVELEGCTPGMACEAALECFREHGAVPGTDTDWWLTKIRKKIDAGAKSSVRPSEKLRIPINSSG